MASVPLDFLPPTQDNIAALRIYESPAADGSFVQIERTEAVGTYPNYISKYTTDQASNAGNWFAIQWEDEDGNTSEISSPLQGGTRTLVQDLIDRVLLRDSTLDENIVAQEAEAVLSSYYGVNDPYTLPSGYANPAVMSGLTLLTMAHVYLFKIATTTSTGTVQKFTAGLVSMDQGSSASTSQQKLSDIEDLIRMANISLGTHHSVIGLLKEIEVADGVRQIVGVDLTRLIVEIE